MRDITPLVAPRSIAVIGASSNPQKAGGMLFSNLADGGFSGPLYPINRSAAKILGYPTYSRMQDIPSTVDLAYIVVPREHVEAAIYQCVEARTRAACIVTAGFSESGSVGRAEEDRLRNIARTNSLLLAGPNTIGMVNANVGMMGSFVKFPRWEKGGVSVFAQTGIFTGGVALTIMNSQAQRIPMSISIDVGNKIDVDELDFLEYVAKDTGTSTIGLYLERIDDRSQFLAMARELSKVKPIVLLKPGRTAQGQFASAAHTGSLPTSEGDLDEELIKAGIIRVDDEEEFVDTLRAFALLPTARGRRVGIATTSGALGVISTDLVVQSGLEVAQFKKETVEKLESILPSWMKAANPYDFWVAVDTKGGREAHQTGLTAVFEDPNVDIVLCTLMAAASADFDEFGSLLANLRARHNKPVAMVIYGGSDRERWVQSLEGAKIPVFTSTRQAIRVLASIARASSPKTFADR